MLVYLLCMAICIVPTIMAYDQDPCIYNDTATGAVLDLTYFRDHVGILEWLDTYGSEQWEELYSPCANAVRIGTSAYGMIDGCKYSPEPETCHFYADWDNGAQQPLYIQSNQSWIFNWTSGLNGEWGAVIEYTCHPNLTIHATGYHYDKKHLFGLMQTKFACN